MKKIPLTLKLLFVCFLIHFKASAQLEKYFEKKITPEMLLEKHFPDDSSIHAMVITDIGEIKVANMDNSSVNPIEFKRSVRIKIFDKVGFEMCNQQFVLLDSKATYSVLKGATYNLEEGKVVKSELTKEMISKEHVNKSFRLVKFTFPDIKEGCIIDFEYSTQISYIPTWYFQRDVPVLSSEVSMWVPEFFEMRPLVTGVADVREQREEKRDFVVYQNGANYTFFEEKFVWKAAGIPAVKKEPYSLSQENFYSRIDFVLASINMPGSLPQRVSVSWGDVSKRLLAEDNFGKLIHGNSLPEEVSPNDFIQKYPNELERATAIFDFVKNSIVWDGYYGKYTNDNLKDVWKTKTGNVAEINLFLIKLLKEAKIDVTPLVINTNDIVQPLELLPDPSAFNAVIALAKINEVEYKLDASQKKLPFGLLSPDYFNSKAKTIDATEERWVSTEVKEHSSITTSLYIELNADGNYNGKGVIALKGYHGLIFRNQLKDASDSISALGYLNDVLSELDIKQIKIDNFDSLNLPVKLSFNFNSKVAFEQTDDFLFFPIVFLGKLEKNPFVTPTRENPVYFDFPVEENLILNIKLPENSIIDESPKNVNLANSDQSIRYSLTSNSLNNNLQISEKYVRKKCVFNQGDDYQGLKAFFNQIMSKQKEQIVLKLSE